MRAKIVEEEVMRDEGTFYALRVETRNANLLLLSEGEDQLGTLAAALPPTERMVGPAVSSILLGDRNVIIARLLAERLAQRTGKIALASVFAKTINEKDAEKYFFNYLMKRSKKEKGKRSESTRVFGRDAEERSTLAGWARGFTTFRDFSNHERIRRQKNLTLRKCERESNKYCIWSLWKSSKSMLGSRSEPRGAI